MRHPIMFSAAILLAACGSNPTKEVVPAAAMGANVVPASSNNAVAANIPNANVTGGVAGMSGMLEAHNSVRQQQGLAALSWSNQLSIYSQEWSDRLALQNACQMQHRNEVGQDKGGYGENLFWAGPLSWSDGRKEVQKISVANVAQAWASEKADYNYANNSCAPGKQCGHYTQMVWKSTTEVGCGMTMCPDKGQIWVCSYNPPGNWVGQKPY